MSQRPADWHHPHPPSLHCVSASCAPAMHWSVSARHLEERAESTPKVKPLNQREWWGLSKDGRRGDTAAETVLECRRQTAVFWKDRRKPGRTRKDLEGPGRTSKDLEGPAKTWKDLQRPPKIWKDLEVCGSTA